MITIKTNGVEITVETAEEFHIVMGHDSTAIQTVNLPEMPTAVEPKQENNHSDNVTPINTVNGQSRYYAAGNGRRRFRSVARVYDYIEMHKRGRTSKQVADHFGVALTKAQSTLNVLKNEGLIYQPNGRATPWVVTADMEHSNANES